MLQKKTKKHTTEASNVQREPSPEQTVPAQPAETLRNQYHPAFCDAMTQILEQDTCHYEYAREYNLNSMPNRIDLLVIKKDENDISSHEIGKLFRKYNICHYKSPGDALNESEYYLAMSYAFLYACYRIVHLSKEITLSFIREEKPRNLIKFFREENFTVSTHANGIYYVKKDGHIDMQIIVTKELDDEYIWLKVLTRRLTRADAMKLAKEATKDQSPQGQIRVRAILDLVSQLNKNQKWMEEMKAMGAFWDYFFKDEYEKKLSEIAERDETIQIQSEQLQNQSEQLQNQSEQLQNQSEQLQNQSEQLQNQSEQLQILNEQLQTEKNKTSILQKEIKELKKQMGKIAAL